MDLDVQTKATIILCLSDEVLYNVMNKKITAGLWYKLESIQQTLFEEASIQSSDERRNTSSAIWNGSGHERWWHMETVWVDGCRGSAEGGGADLGI